MAEVLDQSEIDALLNAVEETVSPPQAARPQVSAAKRIGAEYAEARRYDFKRPERVSKDQIRALSAIHEVFARNFGATLSGMLRTIIDVRVVGVEQLTYSEFIHSLPNPTCFNVLQAPPLEGQMCLEVSPLIVYPILDRLLGGNSANMFIPQRPLTSIEWRLIGRMVSSALKNLSEVWRNLVNANFELVETESNAQLIHIVAPTEVVVFVTFEIKLGQHAGTMGLCVPFNTIESVLSRLTTQSWFYKPKTVTDVQRRRLERSLVKGQVELVAYLGQTRVRLSDWRQLQPGDLIPIDKRADREVLIRIGGRNKFAGRIGQFQGKRAIHLTRPAEPDEVL